MRGSSRCSLLTVSAFALYQYSMAAIANVRSLDSQSSGGAGTFELRKAAKLSSARARASWRSLRQAEKLAFKLGCGAASCAAAGLARAHESMPTTSQERSERIRDQRAYHAQLVAIGTRHLRATSGQGVRRGQEARSTTRQVW